MKRAGTLAVLVCAVLALGGCSSQISGTAVANPADIITEVTEAPSTEAPTPPPPDNSDNGGQLDIDVAIGECVRLGGTVDDATIDNAACGSQDANYKVVGKAPDSESCVDDANQYYYETLAGVPQGALCLDIDWVVDGCMELSGDEPQRADCTLPGSDTVRVVDIVQGSADLDSCPAPNGFTYDTRNFVVCLDDL